MSRLHGHLKKNWLDKKGKVDFKLYDVTTWLISNYSTCITNISQIKDNQTVMFDQLMSYQKRNIFLQRLCGK